MKTKNLIRAIEHTGLQVEPRGNNGFFVQGPERYGEFYDQDGEAICISTCRNGLKADSMTDYFPQMWHDTIKSFIHYLTEQRQPIIQAFANGHLGPIC